MKKIASILLSLALVVTMLGINTIAAGSLVFGWAYGTDIGVSGAEGTYDYDFVMTLKLNTNPGTATVGGFIEYNHNDVEIVSMIGSDADDNLMYGTRTKNSFPAAVFNPILNGNLDKGYFVAAGTKNATGTGNLLFIMFKIKAATPKTTQISFVPEVNSCVNETNGSVPFSMARYTYTANIAPRTWTFTLTFEPNNGDAPISIELPAGATTFEAPTFIKVGSSFLGWSIDGSTVLSSFTMPAHDTTLYAVWRLATHEVIVREPTSTKEGLKEIQDGFGNVINSEPIAKLPHFGTLRGVQVPSGAILETTTVRLILGINSLEYTKAGFIIAAQTNLNKDGYTPGDEFSKEITSSTVYETLTTGGNTYKAEDFGAKYLVVIEIANFPHAAYDYFVRFQGFAVTEDGQYHFDTKTITTVATLIG